MADALGGDRPPLSAVDITTLGVYFVCLFAIGLWSCRRKNSDSTSYFLAERAVPWWAVAASLFASNIGSEHFVGLAGNAAKSGIAVGWYEWGAVPCLILLGYVFLPVYLDMGCKTMPDYLERRYNKACRTSVVALSLVLYIFTKISATLYAGSLILEQVSHIDKWLSAVLLIVGTAVYTVLGGLSAVIYTEALQTVVLLVGGSLLLFFGLQEVGGFSVLREELPDSFFHLFRPVNDPEYPWTGFLVGYYAMSLWYWACDQVIVQRALAARNVAHGRAGAVGAAYLKVVPVFIMVFPGMIARVLMERDGVIDRQAPTDDTKVYDSAYPWLMFRVLPEHTHGLLLAAILSSLMSSLASVFNSSSTLFTIDVFQVLRPAATETQLVWVGRVAVVGVAVVSVLWLPVIPLFGDQLFIYIQKPVSFMAPAVFALFIWGMMSARPTGRGGGWALAFGIGFGMARFVLEIVLAVTGGEHLGNFLRALAQINFLHFAVVNFLATSAVLFVASSVSSGAESGDVEPRGTRAAASATAAGGAAVSTTEVQPANFTLFRRTLYRELMDASQRRGGHESEGGSGSGSGASGGGMADDKGGLLADEADGAAGFVELTAVGPTSSASGGASEVKQQVGDAVMMGASLEDVAAESSHPHAGTSASASARGSTAATKAQRRIDFWIDAAAVGALAILGTLMGVYG